MIIGALPSSGLTANSPDLTKVVGIVVAALAAVNYTMQRSALKRAYAAATAAAAPQLSLAPKLAASALLVAAFATVGISCGSSLNCSDPKNAQSFACVVEGSVVDCTGVSSLPTAVAVVTPIAQKLIASAQQPDGSINWSAIESQFVDLALQYGMCVVAEVWNQLMNGGGGGGSGSGSGSAPAPTPMVAAGSGTAPLPKLSSTDLAKEFDRIRSRVSPGRQFKTSGGTL